MSEQARKYTGDHCGDSQININDLEREIAALEVENRKLHRIAENLLPLAIAHAAKHTALTTPGVMNPLHAEIIQEAQAILSRTAPDATGKEGGE